MKDFFITNKDNINIYKFKKKIGSFYLYSSRKIDLIKHQNSLIYVFGDVYEKFQTFELKNKIFDGRYCSIQFFNNSIKINVDLFSRIDIFYAQESGNFYLSNNFNHIVKNLIDMTLDQIAIGHSLNVIGIRPPKKSTFFKKISRIGVNETLEIKKNKILVREKKFKSTPTENYKDDQIKKYIDIYQDYLNKISSVKKKNIYMSSGFDSSFLAANQKKLYGSKNIMGHTVIQKLSKRSKIYNIFELNRIKKLKKHFGFDIKLSEVNLVKNFQKYSEEISELSSSRMMTNTLAAFMHFKLANSCKKSSFSNEAYAGEVSDGVHNLGFSQFFSLIDHEANGFREYSDKKMCYLYSPTFLKKITSGSFKNDFIFNEFVNKKFSKIKKINTNNFNNIFFELCNSLFNSNSRLPFNEENNFLFKKNLTQDLFDQLKKDYFSKVVINNSNEIYSAYIYLYNSFHWQASTICTMYNFADKNNINMYLPYWNPKLHDYLSKMPEEWGRGLEVKNIKYPLKESFRRYLDYPKILEEGYHSYMYDVKKYSDPILEIIINPETKKYILKILKRYHPCDYLDNYYYDLNKINLIIKKYTKNLKIDKYSNQIFRLYNVSKLLYDLDQN